MNNLKNDLRYAVNNIFFPLLANELQANEQRLVADALTNLFQTVDQLAALQAAGGNRKMRRPLNREKLQQQKIKQQTAAEPKRKLDPAELEHSLKMQDEFLKELEREAVEKNSQKTRRNSNPPKSGNGKAKKKEKGASPKNRPVPVEKRDPPPSSVKKARRKSPPLQISKEQKREAWISRIYLQHIPTHYRVNKRWATRKVEQIRQFTDKVGGAPIKRYEHMDEEEIKFQRAKHYLLGTERLLADAEFRNLYATPVPRGYRMDAQLIFNERVLKGSLVFGVGGDGVVFHRYFNEEDEPEEVMAEEADADQDEMEIEPEEEMIDSSEETIEAGIDTTSDEDQPWENKKGFVVTVNAQGILEFAFSKEDHRLQIFPAKPEDLNPELF